MAQLQTISNNSILSQQTASSSASLTFSNIPASARTLLLQFTGVTNSVASVELQMQFSTNNGSTFITTGYQSGGFNYLYSSGSVGNQSSTTSVLLSAQQGGVGTNAILSGSCYLYNFNSTSLATSTSGQGSMYDNTSTYYVSSTGILIGTTGVNGFKIFWSSGNINAGRFILSEVN